MPSVELMDEANTPDPAVDKEMPAATVTVRPARFGDQDTVVEVVEDATGKVIRRFTERGLDTVQMLNLARRVVNEAVECGWKPISVVVKAWGTGAYLHDALKPELRERGIVVREMSTAEAVQMPTYLCHKRVQALEIAAVSEGDREATSWVQLHFVDKRFPSRAFGSEAPIFKGGVPKAGDFFVVYADGYTSLSPRKAFLEGYTPVDGSGPISDRPVPTMEDAAKSERAADPADDAWEAATWRMQCLDQALKLRPHNVAEVMATAERFYDFVRNGAGKSADVGG